MAMTYVRHLSRPPAQSSLAAMRRSGSENGCLYIPPAEERTVTVVETDDVPQGAIPLKSKSSAVNLVVVALKIQR